MAKKRGMSFVDVPLVAMKFKSFSHFTFVCFVVLTLKDAGGHIVYIFFCLHPFCVKNFFPREFTRQKNHISQMGHFTRKFCKYLLGFL